MGETLATLGSRLGRTGTNRGSTRARDRGTVRGMKPIIIFALWAFVGWDVGAWAEAYVGIPSVIGAIAGIAQPRAVSVHGHDPAATGAETGR